MLFDDNNIVTWLTLLLFCNNLFVESEALDSWEDEVASTPEDEVCCISCNFILYFGLASLHYLTLMFLMRAQERDDFDENADKKAKLVKKKSPSIEDNRSKKEHINVVFIGHVGEFSF